MAPRPKASPESRGAKRHPKSIRTTARADDDSIDVDTSDAPRFALMGVLGKGGMGTVLAYQDSALGRRVAVKVAREGMEGEEAIRDALLREARVTGALEHPSIIPIYDVGDDPDWGVFYVMRLAQQPNLGEVLSKMRKGQSDMTHGRLLRLFVQVCEALHYAHSRGVIHCDMKPENILLGNFGEVFVVDWGFAYSVSQDAAPRGGTPSYMPPEQLAFRRVDARTDVFALGAILYVILADEEPFPSIAFDEFARATEKGETPLVKPPPPSARALGRIVPPELDEICMRAIELDPKHRTASAGELAAALDAFLEGTKARQRKLARALELTKEGDGFAESFRELHAQRPERIEKLAALRASVAPWEIGASKQALWDAEDRHDLLDNMAARALTSAISAYEQALEELPDHAPARLALSALHWVAAQRAESPRERARLETLALDHDDGTLAASLRRGGSVTIESVPPAAITIHRIGESGPCLAPLREVARETTPLGPTWLPAGSYVATLARHEGSPIAVPLNVLTGGERRITITLGDAPLRADELLVTGGPAMIGGHETSVWGKELREVEVPGFVLMRDSVTFADYLAFVAHRFASDPAVAEALLPRSDGGQPLWRWEAGALEAARIRQFGDDVARLSAFPAFGIERRSALAYAAWKRAATGLPYRLPTELEREKATRGVDARAYPWGNRFDATFCKTRVSREGLPAPEPVGSFPLDVSPYGARDLAGGVSEWVALPGPDPGELGAAITRGGAWSEGPTYCHAASRRVVLASEHSIRIGFRLARDVR